MHSLHDFVERRPRAAFLAFAALHLIVWTALPATLRPNLPLDVIEALTYGREWQLGYDKLPPCPGGLRNRLSPDRARLRLFRIVAGRGDRGIAVIWATARPLVGPVGALMALLIVDGLHYFHYTACSSATTSSNSRYGRSRVILPRALVMRLFLDTARSFAGCRGLANISSSYSHCR
jgi:hypothetical protein